MSFKQDIVNFLKSLISLIGDDTEQDNKDKRYAWSKADIELLHHAAKNECSVYDVLKRLPKGVLTQKAVMSKARRLGYRIRGGKICLKA